MTEDETFNRLKGITRDEAFKMFDSLYGHGIKNTYTPAEFRDFVDDRLKPYGWSIEKLANTL